MDAVEMFMGADGASEMVMHVASEATRAASDVVGETLSNAAATAAATAAEVIPPPSFIDHTGLASDFVDAAANAAMGSASTPGNEGANDGALMAAMRFVYGFLEPLLSFVVYAVECAKGIKAWLFGGGDGVNGNDHSTLLDVRDIVTTIVQLLLVLLCLRAFFLIGKYVWDKRRAARARTLGILSTGAAVSGSSGGGHSHSNAHH